MNLSTNGDLQLIVGQSKKNPTSKYYSLVINLGYTRKYLTFNVSDIAEILGLSVTSILSLDIGEYDVD